MGEEFREIMVPIMGEGFIEALKRAVGPHTHVTYKVFARNEEGRVCARRIRNEDPNGILTIGYGSIRRVEDLVRSLKNGNGHHFGLKYHQVVGGRVPPIDRLFMEICPFKDEEAAKACEGAVQAAYRKSYGENPPYSGRWEGGGPVTP